MNETNCPYCNDVVKIDLGEGFEEDRLYETCCNSCEKVFVYSVSISYTVESAVADCLNGGSHDYQPVIHYPRVYPDWVRCADCGHETRGMPNKTIAYGQEG